MDKYEYRLRADEIKALIKEKKYKEAAEVADTVDWKNVKNSVMLCTISDIYKVNKRYDDAREILLLAYDRNPGGRLILYSLSELSIKLGDIVNALEYYKEFVQVAPMDSGKYVLQYKIYTAIGDKLDERIAALEELQNHDRKEKWMYELAHLYHIAGEGEKCVEECNQIIIYFGDGKYVIKALELMALHTPLSEDYEFLYRRLTAPEEDIKVSSMEVGQYNPDDLQKELASNLQEILGQNGEVPQAAPVVEEIIIEEVVVDETAVETVAEPEAADSSENAEAETEENKEEIANSESEKTEDEGIKVAKTEETEPSQDESIFNTTMYKPITLDIPIEDEATKVIDVRAVNRALESETKEPEQKPEGMHIVPPSDTGFKGEVIEPAKPWDMHEIDLGGMSNEAIKYPNYDDMVSVEGDGQLSIVMPEQEKVDKQITGQISIDDILLEWERMKNESDKKWNEDVKQRVLDQTNNLFENFERESKNGLLEELESAAETQENTQPEIINNTVEAGTDSETEFVYEEIILLEEEEQPVTETEPGEPLKESEDEAVQNSDENQADETEVTTDSKTVEEQPGLPKNGDISEIIIDEENESAATDTEEIKEDPSPEELIFDRTPYISDKKEEEKEEVPDDTAVMPDLEQIDYFMKFAANIEEKELAESALFGAAAIIANGNDQPGDIYKCDQNLKETDKLDSGLDVKQDINTVVENVVNNEVTTDTEKTDDNTENEAAITEEEPVKEESVKEESVNEESVNEEFVNEDCEADVTEPIQEEETVTEPVEEEESAGKESEETTGEQVGEAEVSAETEEAPEPEQEEQQKETDIENTESESETDSEAETEAKQEKIETADENKEGLLSEAQLERYDNFVHAEGMEEQIADTLAKVSIDASHGNIIIGSDDVDGAIELGKCIISEFHDLGLVTGKVAKIKASTLNNKDVNETFDKLEDGGIIIQDVGDLTPEVIAAIDEKISDPEFKIIVVLTAQQRNKHKFIMSNTEFIRHFDASIDLISMDDQELVEYAKEYALLRERSIDEVALLAIHRKIEEKQTNTHAVTISEVREIIDEAIEKSNKKSVGHFFKVLLGNRCDENDMIILRENDFE